jgi:hypothetical protein
MDEIDSDKGKRSTPVSVVGGTRVTVAFPFSKIALHEPSDDLRDLAALVADLADAVADGIGTDAGDSLRTRAAALRQRLAALSNR